MNNKLVCIVASFQFFCVSASSFTPPQSPMKHSFSPYSPISYLAPSPKSVALCSPVKKTMSPQKSKVAVVSKQVDYKDEFIENVTKRRNIDVFIALALKHEESLLRRSQKAQRSKTIQVVLTPWR